MSQTVNARPNVDPKGKLMTSAGIASKTLIIMVAGISIPGFHGSGTGPVYAFTMKSRSDIGSC
jgi:hypothetical protein